MDSSMHWIASCFIPSFVHFHSVQQAFMDGLCGTFFQTQGQSHMQKSSQTHGAYNPAEKLFLFFFVTPNLSLPHPFSPLVIQVCSLCLWVCICFVNKFICTIFSIPHISNITWHLSFSDLLHSVWESLGPSMLLQMASFHSFLWLSSIPLHIRTTSSLSIPLSMDN